MHKIIIYLLIVGISGYYASAQNLDIENLNLMPWPKEIEQTDAHFNINNGLTISLFGDDNEGRVNKAAVNFLRHLSNKTGILWTTDFLLRHMENNLH